MKRYLAFLICLVLLVCAPGVPAAQAAGDIPSCSKNVFAMDTFMTITCYGERCEEAAEAAVAEIQRIDNLLSVGLESSEISRINRSGSGVLSDDTAAIVEKSMELWEKTGGAFDITVYPLMELWGFTSQNFRVPEQAELDALLAQVGAEKLRYDPEARLLELGAAAGIDLGGIAKGYTSHRLMEIFADYELLGGIVSLGGNLQCYGTKPDGSLWRCGIRNPLEPENPYSFLGILAVESKALITSGAYERFFVDEASGKTYHHILDPKTGYPADSDLNSVTIVSNYGMLADGLSTSCYILGLEGAIAYWREYGDDFDMVLMTNAGEVYITEALAPNFSSDYPTHVVER